MPAQPYDPTLKTLVETEPESCPAFLGGPVGPTTVIDADIATVSGATDKVLRVAAAAPYPVHLEFVAGHDGATLPGKLHVRNALLDQRHRLPVRTAAVLLRPEADSPRLTGVLARGFSGEEAYLTFRYQVLGVWQLPPKPLLNGGLPLLALAPISAVTETELPGIIDQMKRRLRRARRLAGQVWGAAYILMGLRRSPALAAHLFRGVVSMKESSTYQAILEEGRQEGRREGRKEGAIDEMKKTLRLVGDKAFGSPDAQVAARIDQLNDLAQLEELAQRLRTATSWQELLSPLPSRRPQGKRR